MYLDGNGAELATEGDVGVFSFVTDGDLVVGVDDVVGVRANLGWSMAVFVIVGELKSNDKRDLWDINELYDGDWFDGRGCFFLTLAC